MVGTNSCAAFHPRSFVEERPAERFESVRFFGDGASRPFRQDVHVASRARSLKSSCQNRADRFRSSNEFMMIAEGVVLGHKGRTPDDPRKDGMLVEWCEVRLAFIEATIGGGLPNGACPIVSGDPERAGVASIYRLT